ncbi:hypothetical protein LLH06_03370 [Mucilaginibacter daejeonensis]|uniref:hypothetical protein n=1 Tax=Mucilaginibacter daejeonensis TaxID=398049 RepID=UPI001D17010E|nr:hypothetical protein [Mucilaginibacter daejeonensis]UEG54013.1 hypothetical protein LLH06_03370 [Mucilaginibacter daejeonensis]
MYTGSYAPWENAPKFLKQEQVARPLKLLEEFFQMSSVEGHAVQLREWRDFAVSSEYYNDERSGPGLLLYIWEYNVKLVEAMYVLWHEHCNIITKPSVSKEQLEEEKAEWEYFPTSLEEHQLMEPFNVVKLLFGDFDLAVLRDHLYEWLEMALTETSGYDDQLTAEEVISVYEHMLKLYDAAWIVHQRGSLGPAGKTIVKAEARMADLEAKVEPLEKCESAFAQQIAIQPQHIKLRPLYPKPTAAEKLGLKKIKEFLLDRFESIQAIIFIGSHPEPFAYFLVILVSAEEKMPEGDMSNKIEDHLRFLAHTHMILHKTSAVIEALHEGNRFWKNVLLRGHFAYQAPDLSFGNIVPMDMQAIAAHALTQWDRWGEHGLEFLKGAEFFIGRKSSRQAAFTLHRAAEVILRSIIQTVTGYRIQMHNLPRLVRMTLLFTNAIKAVFRLDTSEGIQAFEHLKNFHAQAHYKDNFRPEEGLLKTLLSTLYELHRTAELLKQQFIERSQENAPQL